MSKEKKTCKSCGLFKETSDKWGRCLLTEKLGNQDSLLVRKDSPACNLWEKPKYR